MELTDTWSIRDHHFPSRVIFGPHATNLASVRAFSDAHRAYYERRARGGAGAIILEEASVGTDWPYERAPHVDSAEAGWSAITRACAEHRTPVIAALGHTGLQGSSAYSQRALLAPSAIADPVTREVPAVMLEAEIAELVDQFADAARRAISAGCAGVEINIGQSSVLRQFLSGLTNLRGDQFGADGPRGRSEVPLRVLETVRDAIGPNPILAVRLCVDELAPWAGITPDHVPQLLDEFGVYADMITPVRGSIFSRNATRPDGHVPEGFLGETVRTLRSQVATNATLVWQGSNVDVSLVGEGLRTGTGDVVEMTRALIADPDLVTKVRRGTPERIRPCTLCNQRCQVQDARNPIVSCMVEPSAGHELNDPAWESPAPTAPQELTILGGGIAGLETARIAATRGHAVRVLEQSQELGGAALGFVRAPGFGRTQMFVDWLVQEVTSLGVSIQLGHTATHDAVTEDGAHHVVVATGAVAGTTVPGELPTLHAADVIANPDLLTHHQIAPGSSIVIWDAIGSSVGVAVAELLASEYSLTFIHPDPVAGSQLAASGDLAPASTRLLQAGVVLQPRSVVTRTTAGAVLGHARITDVPFEHPAAALIVVTPRLPDPVFADDDIAVRVGDALAPRTIGDAILDARRAVLAMEAGS